MPICRGFARETVEGDSGTDMMPVRSCKNWSLRKDLGRRCGYIRVVPGEVFRWIGRFAAILREAECLTSGWEVLVRLVKLVKAPVDTPRSSTSQTAEAPEKYAGFAPRRKA